MTKTVLSILFFSLIAYIFLTAILKLWGKGKQFIIKKLAIACDKDFENKQYEKEIKKLRWLIWLNPISANYHNRAGKLGNLKQFDDAIKDVSKAININPNNMYYYMRRAYYYDLTEKTDLAIEDYNSAIKLRFNSKDDYKLFLFRAQSLEDKGEYQLAINDYDIAIKNIPEEIEAYTGKGFCLFNLEKYEEALSCYQKAIELDDKNHLAFYSRGELFYHLKKGNEALQDLNKALELKPTTEKSYLFLWLGDLYAVVEKDNERAMNFLQKAKDLGNKYAQEHIDELSNTGTIVFEW